MPVFRRICCPVDFSEASRAGLEMAARLARRDGAGLTVLHVTGMRWPGEQGEILPGRHAGKKPEAAQLAEWTGDAERLAGWNGQLGPALGPGPRRPSSGSRGTMRPTSS